MMQAVVSVENVVMPNANGSGGSNFITLACGHTVRRKYSQGVPKLCNCKECDDIASGRITVNNDIMEYVN